MSNPDCYPDSRLKMLPWEEDQFVDRLTYNLTQPPTESGVILCALISQDFRHKKIQVIAAKPTIKEIKAYYLANLS